MPAEKISILTCFRDSRPTAEMYLRSLLAAEAKLGWAERVEYILIDDHSGERWQIPELLGEFRSLSRSSNITLLYFTRHMHFNYGVSLGLSLARGDVVLFFSHDMSIPADCITTLLEASAAYAEIGMIRPRSRHMDGAAELQIEPQPPPQTPEQADHFAAAVRKQFGLTIAATDTFICDAALYTRAVIERIGVFDPRYFGFWGDIDYGLRAQRAGLEHGIALGAWLHHVGKGSALDPTTQAQALAQQCADATAAYALFRGKWNPSLPEDFREANPRDIAALRGAPANGFDLFQPPLKLDAQIVQVL